MQVGDIPQKWGEKPLPNYPKPLPNLPPQGRNMGGEW